MLAAAPQARAHVSACDARAAYNVCAIHHWRDRVWRVERILAAHPTRYDWTADRSASSATYRRWVRRLWYLRSVAWSTRLRPYSIAWLRDALCIHRGEGSWTDPDAPYWGGMQMDESFMRAYGARFYRRWGTADRWPPADQLLASYRAWRSRGFEPWPNTAAACGLL